MIFYVVNIFMRRNVKILKGKTESLTVTISEYYVMGNFNVSFKLSYMF